MATRLESRRGGRKGMRAARGEGQATLAIASGRAMRQLRNPFRPIEVFSQDQIEAIHRTSLRILEEIGIKVLNDEALEIFAAAGASVQPSDSMVRLDAGLIDQAMANIPPVVTLRSRNPERTVVVGRDHLAFSTVGGPPNVSDIEQGRRPGTLEAFRDFVRLAQSFDIIHMVAPAVEPMDIEPRFRHLELTAATLTLSEKTPFLYCRGRQAVADAFELVRIANGLTPEEFMATPYCYTVVNSNSPLQLDDLMCKGIIDFARAGQLMVLTPFTLAGAMAPVSLPGALAQQNAEALAGLALAQLVRPGTPVAYGGFTSNVDMKSGAPAFGTPEYVQAAFASGQLARRYHVPFRSSNVNTANIADAQASYEAMMSTWGAVMGGCNILLHGAGWLEGGLSASYEKFIIDVEILQMFATLFQGVPFDEGALGLDAVREVGPGGHYFGAAHTLERYENAFYAPLLSDWRNFETWRDSGSIDTTTRAHQIYKQVLANFEAPPLAAAAQEAIDDFVARRRSEGGADLDQ